MKSKKLIIYSLCLGALVSCNKKSVEAIPETKNDSKVENYGITSESGRLRFKTIEQFSEVASLNGKAHRDFVEFASNIDGFTSKLEKLNTNLGQSKSVTSCNCSTEDEYVNSIANEYYMVDIEDWIVKIDVCNNKFYILDRLNLTTTELNTKIAALESCDFTPVSHIYSFTFDSELTYELDYIRDSLNGEVYERCDDVACSDREDASDSKNFNYAVNVPYPNGPTMDFTGTIPTLRMKYNKNIVNGSTKVYVEQNGVPYGSFYQLEFAATSYKKKCDSWVNRAAELKALDPNNTVYYAGVTNFLFDEYYGKRLTAGQGSVKVRVVNVTTSSSPYWSNVSFMGDWAEIVF